MKKLFIAAAVVSALSGCATVNQPIDQKAVDAIKGQTVTHTARAEKPSFVAMTAGKAAFALLGAAAMISEGNGIVASNAIPDPADFIATELTQALQTAHGATALPAVRVDGDAVGQLATAAGSAKYVIDVQTTQWTFAYFPTDWTHYYVIYGAKARLIDTATKTVMAEGACSRSTKDAPGAPTYDEMLANGAKRLKGDLSTVAAECLQQFKRDTFKL
ncbi:MAG: hypothetical protein QM749_14905 [Aquabacterium sp.]